MRAALLIMLLVSFEIYTTTSTTKEPQQVLPNLNSTSNNSRISLDESNFAYTSMRKNDQLSSSLHVVVKEGHRSDGTITTMNRPTCGPIYDEKTRAKNSRPKRYTLLGSKWSTTNLTYNVTFDHPPSWFNPRVIPMLLNGIEEGFRYWARESPLQFQFTPHQESNITIRFTSKRPLGTSDGLLGGSYSPPDGRIFLDLAEDWTTDTFRGYNIFQAAAHEIGHALGLDHSKDDASVMQEIFLENRYYFRTAPDDIKAIRALYGNPIGCRNEIDLESSVYESFKF